MAIEQLLDGEGEAITRKAIELAKEGNMAAIRICLDRLAPARKDRPIEFTLPKMEKASDAVKASAPRADALLERWLGYCAERWKFFRFHHWRWVPLPGQCIRLRCIEPHS